MWRGYEHALSFYMNCCIDEWVRRGRANRMSLAAVPDRFDLPPWLGREDIHAGYRSNLLRKDPAYYGRFGWAEDDALPYVWPIRRDSAVSAKSTRSRRAASASRA
jgi:hypothetical protein